MYHRDTLKKDTLENRREQALLSQASQEDVQVILNWHLYTVNLIPDLSESSF